MPRLRIALIASLIVNLFLLGGLAGGAIWLRAGPRMIQAGSLRIAGSELPVAERRAFRRALRDARRSVRPTIATARAAKAEAAALLRQPVLDQPATLAALDRARTADMQVRAAVETSAVAFAATLPPTERTRLADAMTERADRRTSKPPRDGNTAAAR